MSPEIKDGKAADIANPMDVNRKVPKESDNPGTLCWKPDQEKVGQEQHALDLIQIQSPSQLIQILELVPDCPSVKNTLPRSRSVMRELNDPRHQLPRIIDSAFIGNEGPTCSQYRSKDTYESDKYRFNAI